MLMSRVNMAYRRLLRVVHHRNTFQYSNGVFLNGTRTALRYYSKEGSKAGGSGKGSSSKPNNGGGGFFKKFVDSVKKSVKEDDVQESLKGFHEEREKMQQSYIVQQARQKLKDIKVGAEAAGSVGTEKTSESWTKVKSATSKVTLNISFRKVVDSRNCHWRLKWNILSGCKMRLVIVNVVVFWQEYMLVMCSMASELDQFLVKLS